MQVIPAWLTSLISIIIAVLFFYAEIVLHWEMLISGWAWVAMGIIGILTVFTARPHAVGSLGWSEDTGGTSG
jgi:hypothetical protein